MGIDMCRNKNFCILESSLNSKNTFVNNIDNSNNNIQSTQQQSKEKLNLININSNGCKDLNLIYNNNKLKRETYFKDYREVINKVLLIQKNFRIFIKNKKMKNNNNNNDYLIKETPNSSHLKLYNSKKLINDANFFYNISLSNSSVKSSNIEDSLYSNRSNLENCKFNIDKKKFKYHYFGYLKNKSFTFSAKKINKKIKNGYGKIIYSDESIFKGFFKENLAYGICLYNDKQLEFYGEYSANIPNGFGICINHERKLMGKFKGNFLEEEGIESIKTEKALYEGNFERSKKSGIGTFKWSDGTVYKGEFKNNSMNGFGIIIYPNKNIYKGEVKDGYMQGYGEFYWKDYSESLKRYIGEYNRDRRHGFGIFIWGVNPIEAYIGFWNNGEMNGVGIKISNNKFKYGIWNQKNKEVWLNGPWEFSKHMKLEQMKYLKILKMHQNQLSEYVLRLALISCNE